MRKVVLGGLSVITASPDGVSAHGVECKTDF